jgi:uncharacterized protein (TIGR02246 family)
MKCLFNVLFACILFVSASSTLLAQDWTKVRETIEKNNKKLVEGMLAGDAEQMTAFYTDDAISLPGYEPAARGISEIKKKTLEGLATGYKITAAQFETTDVIGGGNLAVEVGKWIMTITVPGNPAPMNDKGKYVTVWEKQSDDTWKIKVETWNTDSNPAMMSEGNNNSTDEMK